MGLSTIGIIGAGVMGSSLCEAVTLAGFKVILIDSEEQKLEQFRKGFANRIKMLMIFQPQFSNVDPTSLLENNIKLTTDYRAASEVDIVIENVTENEAVKKTLYRKLDAICAEKAIYISNTSAIPITKQASWTKRPDRFIGVHFMNPVTLKPTVELIPGKLTSSQTIDTVKEMLNAIGKSWVRVNDAPGFISNRVLMLTINEAIRLVEENVSTAGNVDKVFKECFGHKMGPLETADLIGLDTILNSLVVLRDNLNDTKFEPCNLLAEMVSKGLNGKKSKKGFYSYN